MIHPVLAVLNSLEHRNRSRSSFSSARDHACSNSHTFFEHISCLSHSSARDLTLLHNNADAAFDSGRVIKFVSSVSDHSENAG